MHGAAVIKVIEELDEQSAEFDRKLDRPVRAPDPKGRGLGIVRERLAGDHGISPAKAREIIGLAVDSGDVVLVGEGSARTVAIKSRYDAHLAQVESNRQRQKAALEKINAALGENAVTPSYNSAFYIGLDALEEIARKL